MARTPWKMYSPARNFPGRCSCEFYEIAKKLTLDFKLDSRLTLKNFSQFFFSMPTANLKKKVPFYTMCLSSLFKEL